MTKIVSMWGVGVANLTFTAIGLIALATLLGLPLVLGAAAAGVPQEAIARLLAYSSPLWAPFGAGLGLLTASRLYRGLRSGTASDDRKGSSDDGSAWLLWALLASHIGVACGAYLLFRP